MNRNRFVQRRSYVRLAGIVVVGCLVTGTVAPAFVAAQVGDEQDDESSSSSTDSTTEGKVLRHAVFFKFKDSSSAEDVNRIVDEFAALPSKIEAIIDYQAGENNSPQNLNDGLTHCFFVTFKDEAGRDAYLPHDAHQAFVSLLRPHLEKAFVVDYWASPSAGLKGGELKHLVFVKFKEGTSAADMRGAVEAFAALPAKIDTVKGFERGLNNSPENLNEGFTHCFALSFDSEEGLAKYLTHPEHQAFVAKTRPLVEEVRALDFWARKGERDTQR